VVLGSVLLIVAKATECLSVSACTPAVARCSDDKRVEEIS